MTQLKHLPFALPDIGDEEIQAVVSCMKSGWVTTGPNAKKFEEDFSNYLGNDLHSVAVNSASMGILLTLEAMGIGAGDEVIIPTYTFSATGMMTLHTGAKVVLCDVDPNTFNIDVTKIEALITPKTKLIMPVHFAGQACDMDAIHTIAKKHNLRVAEDAAHALPTHYKGKKIGNHTSDATIYSFYATKTITTGEGGMIVTSNEEIAKRCRIMRLHGISRDVFDRYTAKGSKWYYEIVAPGHKCNLTDIAASIGIEQLKKADVFHQKRLAIANRYLEAFKDLPIDLPVYNCDIKDHAWHLFVIKMNDQSGMTRDEFIAKMDEKGIGCSVHFIPLHLHPFWQKELNVERGDFPNSEKAFDNVVSLPIYTKMSEADIQNVIQSVRDILC
jgi:dTDP-4-amino-4,6-dideoxygalactose transaminase